MSKSSFNQQFLNLICFIPPEDSETIAKARIDSMLKEAKNRFVDYEWRIILIGSSRTINQVIQTLKGVYPGFCHECQYYPEPGTGHWHRGNMQYGGRTVELYEVIAYSVDEGVRLLQKNKYFTDSAASLCAGNKWLNRKLLTTYSGSNIQAEFSQEPITTYINFVWLGAGENPKGPMRNRFEALASTLTNKDYSSFLCRIIITGTPIEQSIMVEILKSRIDEYGGSYVSGDKTTDASERVVAGYVKFDGERERIIPVYVVDAYSGLGNLKSLEPFLWDADGSVYAASYWFGQRIAYMIRRLNRRYTGTWPKEGWTMIQSSEREAFYDNHGIAYGLIHIPGMLGCLDWGMSQWRKLKKKGQKRSEKRSRVETHPGLF